MSIYQEAHEVVPGGSLRGMSEETRRRSLEKEYQAQRRLHSAQTINDTDVSVLRTDLDAVTGAQVADEASITTLQGQVGTLSGSVATLQANVLTLQGQVGKANVVLVLPAAGAATVGVLYLLDGGGVAADQLHCGRRLAGGAYGFFQIF